MNIYLSDIEEGKLKANEVQDILRGTWTVRIPNLRKIDIQDPITRKLQPPISYSDRLKKLASEQDATLYSFLTAGYIINPNQWGVYAILVLAAVMIFVYLNLLYPLKLHFHFNKRSTIFCTVIVSDFCFAASESYITFFAQLGKGVFWINYIFMLLYVVSVIILFLINRKIKVT